MPGDPRDFHREQEHPWSCIASCVAILKAWSGPDPAPTEAELLACWSDPKTDLTHLANEGALRVWDANDPRDLDRLRAALQDMWLIVTLFPGPLTFFSLARQPALISKHGPLVRGDDPRHLAQSVVARVGAARARAADWLQKQLLKRLFERLLDAGGVGLALPSGVAGSVVFDRQF